MIYSLCVAEPRCTRLYLCSGHYPEAEIILNGHLDVPLIHLLLPNLWYFEVGRATSASLCQQLDVHLISSCFELVH